MKKTTTSTETRGRPCALTVELAKKIIELYGQGKTEMQVSDIIGVSDQTLRNWKKGNKEFFWASKEAKQMADSMVEAALFKRAVGMSYIEEQATKEGIVSLQRYSVPDVKAQQFWLKNRKPKTWKERVELTHEAGANLILNLGNGQKKFDV